MNLETYLSNPNVKAFLRVIRAGETSQDDVASLTILGWWEKSSNKPPPNIIR
jgi:hypothetical protein